MICPNRRGNFDRNEGCLKLLDGKNIHPKRPGINLEGRWGTWLSRNKSLSPVSEKEIVTSSGRLCTFRFLSFESPPNC
jgi:hypothetical protein